MNNDDWAHRHRLCYGTLICDLESNRHLDLHPCEWGRDEMGTM